MVPPAPSLFSITTVWPSVFVIATPSVRATTSVGPPAANGTMSVTGRDGYWPHAATAAAASASAQSAFIASLMGPPPGGCGDATLPPRMPGPLSNLKVIEMGTLIAGPYCARLLAEFGADVVKVETPGEGDPLRKWRRLHEGTSLWWYAQARNKKSIAVNLREPDGQAIVRRLPPRARVAVQNFRPGPMEEWGLAYDTLADEKPALTIEPTHLS